MAYKRHAGSKLAAVLKRTKDSKVRALIVTAYDLGHKDGYMQALEEVY